MGSLSAIIRIVRRLRSLRFSIAEGKEAGWGVGIEEADEQEPPTQLHSPGNQADGREGERRGEGGAAAAHEHAHRCCEAV